MTQRLNTAETRQRFRDWIDCLLDPTRPPIDQRQAAHEWCEWGLCLLGIDEHDVTRYRDPFFTDTRLPDGKAVSPLGAARCVREYRRTAVFLQATDAAIKAAMERFPGETIHVLEAGCGPLAPLALAFALRYPPERVVFTLLDLHPAALEGARRIAQILGATPSIRAFDVGDASSARFADIDRPHVIVCEVLLRALTKEPQVAITLNLAPQLRAGGLFLPQRIDIDAALSVDDSRSIFVTDDRSNSAPDAKDSAVTEVAGVFSLNAEALEPLQPCGIARLRANRIRVPAHDPTQTPLQLYTRIQIFREHRLGDFESSLNLPERIVYPAALAANGGELEFSYEMSANPGLRIDACVPADTGLCA